MATRLPHAQTMKRFVLGLLLSAALFAQQQQSTTGPLTNRRITELVHSGIRPDELARIIATAPEVSFDLSPSAEQAMMSAGVTEDTIRGMAAREQGVAPGTPNTPQQPTPIYQPTGPVSGTTAAPTKVRTGDYISRGDKEIGLSGTVLIPHIDTGATVGFATAKVGYYVARNSLIGGEITVLASADGPLYIPGGFYRYLQHTANPRLFPFLAPKLELSSGTMEARLQNSPQKAKRASRRS
jgi:hypothetical protein